MPVWPENCLYIGVIVRANIEMPTQAPGATGAAQVQLSDQPAQLFSDSMLAASQASSEVDATNDISPKTAREQAYASVDDSASPAVPDHQGLRSSNPSTQTTLSEQILQTPDAQLINSAATPIDPPIGGVITFSGASVVVAVQAMRLDLATPSTGVESTGDQVNTAQSSGVQSDQAQPGGDPPKTPSKLAGARFQDKEVPVTRSFKTRKDLAMTATAAVSNGIENPGQNAVPNTVPTGVQNSLSDADLSVLSNSTSNAVQSTAAVAPSNTVSNAGQNAAPNAILNAPPITNRDATSNAAPNAVQGTVSNETTNGTQDSFPKVSLNRLSGAGPSGHSQSVPDSAFNGMQDSLPKAYSQALTSAIPNASSNSAPKAVQSAAPNASPNGEQHSLPGADLSVRSDSASNAVQSVAADAVHIGMQELLPSADLKALFSGAQHATSNAAKNAVQSAAPKPVSNGMQKSLSSADLNGLSITIPDGSSNAASNAVGSADINASLSGMQDSLPNADFSGLSSAAPNSPSNEMPNAFESTAQNATHNWLQKSFLKAVLKAFANAGSNAVSNAAPNAPALIVPNNGIDAVPSTVPNVVPNQVQNAELDAVANPASGARSSAEQLPVPQAVPAASTKEVFAAATGSVPVDLAIPPAASPDQTLLTAVIGVPAATVDQFASPAQFSSRSLVEGPAGLSGVNPASVTKPWDISATNGKDGVKGASDDTTSTKLQHASPASNQVKLQRDSQETTPSGDQGQDSPALQGQNTVRPEMNVANHTVAVAAAAQAIVNTSPAQNSAIPAGATAHTAKTPEIATPVPAAVPQALPVINTAKLIQSMGQSEMRVGMRSTEFGTISISTSSTRDLISAQITLDHGELAKTLAAHLPEIQARLGGTQPIDVRIDMNGANAGQTGTAGGMYNGSADQSQGGRHPAGNADSSSSGNRFAGQQLSPGASAAATSDGGFNARLDIRV
jgi:hypothetical protein